MKQRGLTNYISKGIIALLTFGALNSADAQKEIKYGKIFYKDVNVETDAVSIEIVSAVSDDKSTKFKLKLTNKTNDYIIWKPEECKFMINGKEIKPQERWMFLGPTESSSRVIDTALTISIETASV